MTRQLVRAAMAGSAKAQPRLFSNGGGTNGEPAGTVPSVALSHSICRDQDRGVFAPQSS